MLRSGVRSAADAERRMRGMPCELGLVAGRKRKGQATPELLKIGHEVVNQDLPRNVYKQPLRGQGVPQNHLLEGPVGSCEVA